MARRSARLSASAAAPVSEASPSPSTKPPGLAASSTLKGRGRSKVQALSKTLPVRSTAKKSRFFNQGQGSNNSEAGSTPEVSDDTFEDTEGDEVDTFNDTESSGDGDEDDDEDDDEDEYGGSSGNTKRRRSSGPSAAAKKKQKASIGEAQSTVKEILQGKELWREGVRTGLGPGKEVFIKKPKARDTGGIPYRDPMIHPNTMHFLRDLKENNEREWLKGIVEMPILV